MSYNRSSDDPNRGYDRDEERSYNQETRRMPPPIDRDPGEIPREATRQIPTPPPGRQQRVPRSPGARGMTGDTQPNPRQQPSIPGAAPSNPPRQARPGSARSRRDSGLYLPLWSLALMLVFVVMIVGGIALMAYALGGRSAPQSEPVVVVSSPAPTETSDEVPLSPATATIPPEVDPSGGVLFDFGQPADGDSVVPTQGPLQLEGPTLPTVELTPTPVNIRIGAQVEVADVGAQQLNVRDAPGTRNTTIIFRAEEGTVYQVIEGPQQADGLTWWRIQNPNNTSITGWAASNYLEPLSDEGLG